MIDYLIDFLTSTGSSSANSPASDAGFIYPDDETTKKISLHLYARVIHAVNGIVLYPEGDASKPEPFLYWEDGLDATTALIKRYVFVVMTCVLFFTLLCKNVNPTIPKTYLLISAVVLPMSYVPIWQHLIQLNFILNIYIILSDVTIILSFKVQTAIGPCKTSLRYSEKNGSILGSRHWL